MTDTMEATRRDELHGLCSILQGLGWSVSYQCHGVSSLTAFFLSLVLLLVFKFEPLFRQCD